MKMKCFTKIALVAMAVLAVLPAQAKSKAMFKNFKVSTYIRAQDIARMDDDKFLKDTWETVSSQVDLDKIYLETHRDAFIVPEKTLLKVKKFFLQKGLEVGGGITYTRSEPTGTSASRSRRLRNTPPSTSMTSSSTTSSSSI